MKDCEDGSMPNFVEFFLVLSIIIFFGSIPYAYYKDFRLRTLKDNVSVENKTDVADPRFGPAICEFDLTVPASYAHETYIDEFASRTKPLKTTYYFNEYLTSANFASATNKLVPGKAYKVNIFPVLGWWCVPSKDCLAFLKKQKAVLVGVQGLALVFDLKKDKLPKGKWTVSFDELSALPSIGGYRGVPYVGALTGVTSTGALAISRAPSTSASASCASLLPESFIFAWAFPNMERLFHIFSHFMVNYLLLAY